MLDLGVVGVHDLEALGHNGGGVAGQRSRETVGVGADVLVVGHVLVSEDETAGGAEGGGHGPDGDVDGGCALEAEVLGETAAGGAEDTEGHGLVDKESVLVLVLEFDELWQRSDVAGVVEEALGDDELAGDGG